MPHWLRALVWGLVMALCLIIYSFSPIFDAPVEVASLHEYLPPMPELDISDPHDIKSPVEWLRENTYDQPLHTLPTSRLEALIGDRPKAAFIALVRNSEEAGMVHSILQVEARFNSRKIHRYDWIFFNDEPFTDSFKAAITNATPSTVHFEQISQEHWQMPDWIDQSRYDVGREFQGGIGVGKAWLKSYHLMCRWNSGLFALEQRLKNYDWYWRVEPNVQYTCSINYDVFRFMRDNKMAYGFNMAILDDARSFPSLWERTQDFKKHNPGMVNPEADMRWLLHQTNEPDRIVRSGTGYQSSVDDQYNNCQFYSNFEVGSLAFFRSKAHQAYFRHLDRSGGFFYERYGDAPVHTLSVSMFLPKRRVWFFRDIGYAHGICETCPPHVSKLPMGPQPDSRRIKAAELNAGMSQGHRHLDLLSKDFERQNTIPGLACGCTTTALDASFSKLVPYESRQVKPQDTCVRLWLRGKYLLKKVNWNRVAEMEAGGDGYGGYVVSGLESNPFM
ncbi:glycolipid 2-alpha-mannosyltransferase [Seiridium cupressi]